MEKTKMSSTDSVGVTSPPLKITFSEAAKYWTDAIPIGNGRLGGMVWGRVVSELIQLNEDSLWTGIPANYTNPDAPKALAEVRSLVDDGNYADATHAASKLFGGPTQVYQLLGDMKLDFDDYHSTYAEDTYYRELDLDTATASLRYSVGDVEFTREHFASNPDRVIVTRISAGKPGSVSFTLSLDSKLDHHTYVSGDNQIIMEGVCPGERTPPQMRADENPKGIQFASLLHAQISDANGRINVLDEETMQVEGADWAVLLLVASSSFDGSFTKPSDSRKDPTAECQLALKSLLNLSYSDLYKRHLDDYQNLFHRVSLHLPKSASRNTVDGSLKTKNVFSVNKDLIPTVDRIKSFQSDEDPSLVELLFQFGRYLLIACSRPGSQVANLQGIWNKDLQPKWESAPHLNINLQMNYWPSLPCNLSECQEPLFDFIKNLSVSGSKTAQVNYEASGWVVHHTSDIWAKSSAHIDEAVYAVWPMGGAWLCTHLWEHYCYTLDKDFLKNQAYPLLEGCVAFLLDWLIEGRDGYLQTNPSTSPEHYFIAPDGTKASVSFSSTMDMAVIKEVFSSFVNASEVLGRNEDVLVQKVLNTEPRLYPANITKDGCIMEWALDFEDPDVHHRHLSHLFGLFPGHTITTEANLDLCKAAEKSLYKRGEDGPGWSTSWKIALWARLHNDENAYRMVKHLFKLADPSEGVGFEGGLYSNLFTAHPPFQIDANFGFTAAIAEMLVQSNMKDLYLLPALPRDKWANGCAKGLQARGGLTVDICWKEGDLYELGLWLKNESSIRIRRLHYRGNTIITSISPGEIYTYDAQLKCIKTGALG